MTTTQPATHVAAKSRDRIAQLHREYHEAKAEADAANQRLRAVTDALKAELVGTDPQTRLITLTSPGVLPLRLTWVESWRMDTKRLKAEKPDVYVTYAQQSGSWRLTSDKPATTDGSDQ